MILYPFLAHYPSRCGRIRVLRVHTQPSKEYDRAVRAKLPASQERETQFMVLPWKGIVNAGHFTLVSQSQPVSPSKVAN